MENTLFSQITNNQWIIWAILLTVNLIILILGIVFSILYNKKRNEVFLTIKKVSIMATFLAIFLIFIGLNLLLKSIHIEFTYVIPILVGFLLGPLEGMFFSFIADTTNSLIAGYISSYSPLSATLLPMIGLIGGLMGIIYYRRDNYSRLSLMVSFQLVMGVVSALIIVAGFLFTHNEKKNLKIPLMTFAAIIFVVMEIAYLYFFFGKKNNINLQLLTFILITVTLARIIGLIVTPLSNMVVLRIDYKVGLLSMIFHSSYLIPLEGLICYSLIKTNDYIMNLS